MFSFCLYYFYFFSRFNRKIWDKSNFPPGIKISDSKNEQDVNLYSAVDVWYHLRVIKITWGPRRYITWVSVMTHSWCQSAWEKKQGFMMLWRWPSTCHHSSFRAYLPKFTAVMETQWNLWLLQHIREPAPRCETQGRHRRPTQSFCAQKSKVRRPNCLESLLAKQK